MGALTDPIIVFDPNWADTMPEWLKARITLERLAQPLKGEEGVATDAEALAYVSNASLAVPIPSKWVEIYQHLLTREMGDKVPEEMRKETPDDWRMQQLHELKEWLWRQRVKGREERRKAERAREKAEAQARAPKQLKLGF